MSPVGNSKHFNIFGTNCIQNVYCSLKSVDCSNSFKVSVGLLSWTVHYLNGSCYIMQTSQQHLRQFFASEGIYMHTTPLPHSNKVASQLRVATHSAPYHVRSVQHTHALADMFARSLFNTRTHTSRQTQRECGSLVVCRLSSVRSQ